MDRKGLFSKNKKVSATKSKISVDFLPAPGKLTKKETKVKVTITLNQEIVDFFKHYARKNDTKYQTMINEVLDKYVKKYK